MVSGWPRQPRHGRCSNAFMFKHLLVPTDYTPASRRAANVAVELARTLECDLTLLHVWLMPVYPYMQLVVATAGLIKEVEAAAEARLRLETAHVQEQWPRARSLLRMGVPWREIRNLAESGEYDLIVMGTASHRGLERFPVGSNADRVRRACRIPVLTVHEPGPNDAEPAWRGPEQASAGK